MTPATFAVPIRALFQQRIRGDQALLQLARLRFAQAGLGVEVYTDSPDHLDHLLELAPLHEFLPMVHLSREINLLHDRDRIVVETFAARFAGRIAGFVVHDKVEMGQQTNRLVEVLQEIGASLDRKKESPVVFLEYAAGLEPAWFIEVAERVRDVAKVSCCIDVGHVGIKQACTSFVRQHPGLELSSLSVEDDRLPALAAEVQSAVGTALPTVLEMTRSLGALGKLVHFHLHDGHPLIRSLADHFSFLIRVPIPFSHEGRRSLTTLYGPSGLKKIVSSAVAACRPGGVSFTLEIHQAVGRLPLADAAGLFHHWKNMTNAERMNYWLSVLSENALLVEEFVNESSPIRREGWSNSATHLSQVF
jgi:hypothetical protein